MRTRTLLVVLSVVFVFVPVSLEAQSPIKHVVMIVQENRTPDNLFHGFPNADTVDSGPNSKGETVALKPMPLATSYDCFHGHKSFLQAYDGGKIDGTDLIQTKCGVRNPKHCKIPPNPCYKYVQTSDVEPYFQIGEQYVFADRMFSTHQGPSYPAHQFIIAGTSAPSEISDLFVAETPVNSYNAVMDTGCTAPPEQYVRMIDPAGDESQITYPCYEHRTLMDLLEEKGLTWRYYTYGSGSQWTGPNSIRHIRLGASWVNVITEPTVVLTDIANGNLADVVWVIPKGQYGDHSGGNLGLGPSWVASIVNAIGTSPYWADTAILITWDDWGGWYDHVPPQIINSYEYGFRVPLMVVSPYAKQGYVSHVTHDFGSLLKFTEKVFGLPSLGFADARADDLSDCFNFSQQPTKFVPIKAPYNANFFLHDTSPGMDPDDD